MHHIMTWADSVYQCLDHMMTAINTQGYGEIALTPDHYLDFSSAAGDVQWSTSTLITSIRDWFDVWITPWDENLTLPVFDWAPDLQGEPLHAVQVALNQSESPPSLSVYVIRNHVSTEVAKLRWPSNVVQSQADREPFELKLTRTGITLSMPNRGVSTSANFADLGWSSGIVQFAHHSYTPEKDGAGFANSWSWDEIAISPAVPFTMQQITPRILMKDGTLTFPAAAPANAKLRFSGICKIDLDFGSGFTRAEHQPQERAVPEQFSSYFVDVPKGATSVKIKFSGDGWYSGYDCAVADAAIWSR